MPVPFASRLWSSLSYFYFKSLNHWHFPGSVAHSTGAAMAKGTHEPEVLEVVRSVLAEDSLFVDVGANVGYFSRMAAPVVTAGRIVAIEAERANYRALCSNIAGHANVLPLNLAVSDRYSVLDLNISSHSSCHSLVDTDNLLDGSSVPVATVPLDDLWRNYLEPQPIDLVKIDVEGAELMVLGGMTHLLDQGLVRSMLIEYCPAILANAGEMPLNLFEILSRHFTLSVCESQFRRFQDGEAITKEEFDTLTKHLLSLDTVQNVNLFGTRVGPG